MEGNSPQEIAIAKSIYQRVCTRALEHLMGILDGIVSDGRIEDSEVKFLSTWLSANPEAIQRWPGTLIERKVREILADGIITAAEKDHIMKVLQNLGATMFMETGSASNEVISLPINDIVTVTMRDAGVCLTGDFIFGTRAACERLALRAGAMPMDNVSKNVDYLVIGTMTAPGWSHGSYGRKIQRAVELQEQGHAIEIISERRWLEAVPN
jgi:NAD-dependent DNA ligase